MLLCLWSAGGHLNPAVSLGFVLARKISFQRFLLYVIAQLLGAITGAALVKAVSHFLWKPCGPRTTHVVSAVTGFVLV